MMKYLVPLLLLPLMTSCGHLRRTKSSPPVIVTPTDINSLGEKIRKLEKEIFKLKQEVEVLRHQLYYDAQDNPLRREGYSDAEETRD